MLQVILISSLLLGLVMSGAIVAYGLRRKVRGNRVWTTAVVFGVLGLFVASAFTFISLMRNDDSALAAGWLWPTSIMLMAGERGDAVATTLVLFGMAILSNVGVYGLVGLIVGSIWNRIRPAQPHSR